MRYYYTLNFSELIKGSDLEEGDYIEAFGVPKIILFPQTIKKGIIGLLKNEDNFLVMKINFSEEENIRTLVTACSLNEEVIIRGTFTKYNNFSGINIDEVLP